VGGVTVNVQGAATDRHPVLYDIFYLVQYLIDIKDKFIPLEGHLLNKMAITSKLILGLSGCLE